MPHWSCSARAGRYLRIDSKAAGSSADDNIRSVVESQHVEYRSIPDMTLASQSDESKFAHLLQPIRDLAANWDIDVASELEDYLVRHIL